MKIRPEILINNKKEINYKEILITGLDEPFMGYVKNFIINDFKKRNFFINYSGKFDSAVIGSLFSDRKTLFVLSDYPNKTNNSDIKISDDQSLLIISSNGKKTNLIKAPLVKRKDALVIECYPLGRSAKENILKHFIDSNNMVLSSDVFWYVLDNFDNNYVLFSNQLQTLSLFNKKIESVTDLENIMFFENKIDLSKIFFNILNKNQILTDMFNKSINSVSDFYIFLNSIKLYLEIIRSSSDKNNALSKLPKYLFAEKDIFLKIYKQLNKNKLVKIHNNLLRVELLTRKNPDLYSVIGLRFFLSLKKIITS